MIYLAKGLEALGIASVLLGLVQGIMQDDMWIELYLGLIGIALFSVGWLIDKFLNRKSNQRTEPS